MITAITDPRFQTIFYDPRLERTYVHHSGGFDRLASETPKTGALEDALGKVLTQREALQ